MRHKVAKLRGLGWLVLAVACSVSARADATVRHPTARKSAPPPSRLARPSPATSARPAPPTPRAAQAWSALPALTSHPLRGVAARASKRTRTKQPSTARRGNGTEPRREPFDLAKVAPSVRLLGDAFRAYDAGDFVACEQQLQGIDVNTLANRDYYWWLVGQTALHLQHARVAAQAFTALASLPASRFAAEAQWRRVDAIWLAGDTRAAAKQYQTLLGKANAPASADRGAVLHRIALAYDPVALTAQREAMQPSEAARKHWASAQLLQLQQAAEAPPSEPQRSEESPAKPLASAAASLRPSQPPPADALMWYRRIATECPAHPAATHALARLAAAGEPLARFSATDRIARAKQMTEDHAWDAAVAELESIAPETLSASDRIQRDYWLATTLYKMRRRYGEAADLYLSTYLALGKNAAEALFHGARAFSRADLDDKAIQYYQKVVADYPATAWAEEAQFLTGWLEFNRGNYRAAIAPLQQSLARYPKSKWVDDALWFLGMTHYQLKDWPAAQAQWDKLAKRGGSLEGGKGQYWLARIAEQQLRKNDAESGYRTLIRSYPFSWYALLARARLAATGVRVDAFGQAAGQTAPPRGSALPETLDATILRDEAIYRADELLAAGLTTEASKELARAEGGLLARFNRTAALAVLFDRYQRAGNFNRPWMLALTHGASALTGPASAHAQRWWTHAYPKGYEALVEKHQSNGDNPPGYLYSIMRKESGFNPHDISYADAQGLLQMIPATTKRVCTALGIPYADGRLYEPEFNVQTGSWYIGRLLTKFKKQIPIGAGSFNSGPRPVMKWLDQFGDRAMDEFVELVPYTQTREYMKKVAENYARYRYLYYQDDYQQPLTVDRAYLRNEITY